MYCSKIEPNLLVDRLEEEADQLLLQRYDHVLLPQVRAQLIDLHQLSILGRVGIGGLVVGILVLLNKLIVQIDVQCAQVLNPLLKGDELVVVSGEHFVRGNTGDVLDEFSCLVSTLDGSKFNRANLPDRAP